MTVSCKVVVQGVRAVMRRGAVMVHNFKASQVLKHSLSCATQFARKRVELSEKKNVNTLNTFDSTA